MYATTSGTIKGDADAFANADFNNLITGDQKGFGGMNAYSKQSEGNGKKDRYLKAPGEPGGNLWLDLASDVFSQPMGLALFMKDSNADIVGAFYFENCMINQHGFGTDAGGTIITENAQITFERMIPLDTDSLDVIFDDSVFTNTVGSAV